MKVMLVEVVGKFAGLTNGALGAQIHARILGAESGAKEANAMMNKHRDPKQDSFRR